jgi:PAS domain S-box-containing protein
MKNKAKTKHHLLLELEALRGRVAELERVEHNRAQPEEALQTSLERYRVLVENANEAIFLVHDGLLRFVNPKAVDMTGYSEKELTSKPFVEFIYPDDREMVVERYLRRLKGEEVRRVYPFRIVDKDGNIRWVEVNAVLINWEGEFATLALLSDITEHKRVEEALEESEERFRTLFENVPTGIYRTTPDGRIIMANPTLIRMLGYSSFDELASRNLDVEKETFEPTYPRSYFKDRLDREGEIIGLEYAWKRRDGSEVFVRENARAIRDADGSVLYYEGTVEDITEHKRMEEALQEREETLNAILSASPIGIGLVRNRVLDWANEAMYQMVGYEQGALLGKDSVVLYPDAEEYERVGRELYAGIKALGSGQVDTRWVRKDGTILHCYLQARSLDPTDPSRGQIVAAMDITERKKVEEALKENEKKYRMLFENAPVGIGLADLKGGVIDGNRQMINLTGYSLEELKSINLSDTYIDPDERVRILKSLNERRNLRDWEIKLKRKDGTPYHALLNIDLTELEGQEVLFTSVRDITWFKKAEQALRESEKKLRLLSSHLLTAQETERRRVSRELHDELGQALIALKHQLRSVERKLPKGETTLREDFESTLTYIDHIIENVRRLSRDLSPSLLEELDLSAALQRLMDDFTRRYKINISLDLADIDGCFTEKAQIIVYRIFQEALTNIAKHAQATHVSIVAKKQDHGFSFLVEDNGKGFDVKKAMMRNSSEKGLGLAAMDERTWMLGGTLEIRSQEGEGTKLNFTLPICKVGS